MELFERVVVSDFLIEKDPLFARVTLDDEEFGLYQEVFKHLKPSAKNQQGGRLSKEMPIDVSNVLLYCPSCNRGVRIGHRYTDAGQKQRYCKACGAGLGNVGPVKPRRAKAKAAPGR